MPDTSRNFTSMTTEEITSELERADELRLEFKRLKNQLRLHSYCPGLILWTRDRRELRGEEAVRHLRKRLIALTRELIG